MEQRGHSLQKLLFPLLDHTLGTRDVRTPWPRWSLSGPLPWVYLSKGGIIPWYEYSKANGLAMGCSLLLAVHMLDLRAGVSTCIGIKLFMVLGESQGWEEREWAGAWARSPLFMLGHRSPRLLKILHLNLPSVCWEVYLSRDMDKIILF